MPRMRRMHVTDARQQTKFALILALYALLYPTVFFFLTLVPPFSTFLTDPDRVGPMLHLLVGFHITHWWVGVLTLGVIVGLSFLFSHKLFGPMRRFEMVLRNKLSAPHEPVRIQLRPGDFFGDHARLLESVFNGEVSLPEGSPAKPEIGVSADQCADGVGATTLAGG